MEQEKNYLQQQFKLLKKLANMRIGTVETRNAILELATQLKRVDTIQSNESGQISFLCQQKVDDYIIKTENINVSVNQINNL